MKKYTLGIIGILLLFGIYLFFSWDYLKYRSVAKNFFKQEIGFTENVNTYDHMVSISDLNSVMALTERQASKQGIHYKMTYFASASGELALWQFPNRYYIVRDYQGNDSNGVVWEVGQGKYQYREDWKYVRLTMESAE